MKPLAITSGVFLMDPHGRVFVVTQVLTNTKKTHVHQAYLAEYGASSGPERIPVKPEAIDAQMVVEGVTLPIFLKINVRDVEADRGASRAPILSLLESSFVALRDAGIALRGEDARYCVSDPPSKTAVAAGESMHRIRLWCRAKFFEERPAVCAMQDILEAHGLLGTRFTAELVRTIRVFRHFKALVPPQTPRLSSPLV